jgi:hypothetical protein
VRRRTAIAEGRLVSAALAAAVRSGQLGSLRYSISEAEGCQCAVVYVPRVVELVYSACGGNCPVVGTLDRRPDKPPVRIRHTQLLRITRVNQRVHQDRIKPAQPGQQDSQDPVVVRVPRRPASPTCRCGSPKSRQDGRHRFQRRTRHPGLGPGHRPAATPEATPAIERPSELPPLR